MKNFIKRKKKLLVGNDLLARAEELGVVISSDDIVTIPGKGTIPIQAPEYELQRRVLEAERHLREHRIWVIALVSAAASAMSAAAAWFAIVYK